MSINFMHDLIIVFFMFLVCWLFMGVGREKKHDAVRQAKIERHLLALFLFARAAKKHADETGDAWLYGQAVNVIDEALADLRHGANGIIEL